MSFRAVARFGALLLGALAVIPACAEEDGGKTLSAESDLTLAGVTDLGPIRSGQTKTVAYTATPIFRSFTFDARGNDEVIADISSRGGDAMGYITDADLNVLVANDDATPTTLDAKVTYRVPAGGSRALKIVFRDYGTASREITVKLSITSAGGACSYGGESYAIGQTFDSLDGCNRCTCEEGGTVTCGRQTCDCNPSQEPYRTYLGSPSQCITLLYRCPAGETPFANSCGCGCERPH